MVGQRKVERRRTDRDTPINPPRKVRNPILEIVPHNLEHIALVLDNRDARVFRHLPRGVAQAVVGDDGVRVDYEDDLCRFAGLLAFYSILSPGEGPGKLKRAGGK